MTSPARAEFRAIWKSPPAGTLIVAADILTIQNPKIANCPANLDLKVVSYRGLEPLQRIENNVLRLRIFLRSTPRMRRTKSEITGCAVIWSRVPAKSPPATFEETPYHSTKLTKALSESLAPSVPALTTTVHQVPLRPAAGLRLRCFEKSCSGCTAKSWLDLPLAFRLKWNNVLPSSWTATSWTQRRSYRWLLRQPGSRRFPDGPSSPPLNNTPGGFSWDILQFINSGPAQVSRHSRGPEDLADGWTAQQWLAELAPVALI